MWPGSKHQQVQIRIFNEPTDYRSFFQFQSQMTWKPQIHHDHQGYQSHHFLNLISVIFFKSNESVTIVTLSFTTPNTCEKLLCLHMYYSFQKWFLLQVISSFFFLVYFCKWYELYIVMLLADGSTTSYKSVTTRADDMCLFWLARVILRGLG